MKERTWTVLLGAAASWAAAVEGVAQQGYVLVVVGGVLDRSQTWSPVDATGRPQVYRLVGEVVVVNGATLTIEAGTLVVSEPAQRGGLAVTAGCQIHCLGTPEEPVLFTTTADAATWDVVGGLSDPATGAVREAAGEWGRLAVLGRAFVNTDARSGNVPFPDANNRAPMPGLVPRFPGDPSVLHGGGDDADDSGTLRYTSLRYGGQDAAGAAARPGLALGSVGRGTDVEGVDVFSTLGDGIAVSGGTVDLRRLSVWNPGDDGVELELGYRGTVEHVSVVLGNALDGPRGAGVSDRAFELGGARRRTGSR